MPPMGMWRVVRVYDVFSGKALPFSGGDGRAITISELDRTESPADTIVGVVFDREIGEIWE